MIYVSCEFLVGSLLGNHLEANCANTAIALVGVDCDRSDRPLSTLHCVLYNLTSLRCLSVLVLTSSNSSLCSPSGLLRASSEFGESGTTVSIQDRLNNVRVLLTSSSEIASTGPRRYSTDRDAA